MTGYVPPNQAMTVECPTCGSWPNQECVSTRDYKTWLPYPHAARRQAWLDLDVHVHNADGEFVKLTYKGPQR